MGQTMVQRTRPRPQLPLRVKVEFAASMGLFLLWMVLLPEVPGLSSAASFALFFALASAIAFAASLVEVTRQENPHPSARAMGKGAFRVNLVFLPLTAFLIPGPIGERIPAALALVAGGILYEAAYRRAAKRRGIDEKALERLWGFAPASRWGEMPVELRPAFWVVLASAAALGLSMGILFLTWIPAVLMVALFLDRETDLDLRFVRKLRVLALAGAAIGVTGAFLGALVPPWDFSLLLGATPLVRAAGALAGGLLGLEGARLARKGLDRMVRNAAPL